MCCLGNVSIVVPQPTTGSERGCSRTQFDDESIQSESFQNFCWNLMEEIEEERRRHSSSVQLEDQVNWASWETEDYSDIEKSSEEDAEKDVESLDWSEKNMPCCLLHQKEQYCHNCGGDLKWATAPIFKENNAYCDIDCYTSAMLTCQSHDNATTEKQ